MKHLLIFGFLSFCAACNSNKFCSAGKNYFIAGVDTTRPFTVKGQYCIAGISDTNVGKGNAIVKSHLFSRINGKMFPWGIVWFYGGDTLLVKSTGNSSNLIKAGEYIIEGYSVDYIGTRTRKLTIKENTQLEINFYLGTSLIY